MKKVFLAMCAVFCAFFLSVCQKEQVTVIQAENGSNDIGVILNHHATRNFTTGAISQEDLDVIVEAGIRAPSARNSQPWFFTVVQDLDLAQKIIPQTLDGNVIIVISAEGGGAVQAIDCSLAAQSIYLAAQALGYGSRQYTGPIGSLNQNLKGELEIPASRDAIIVIRIGQFDAEADAVSGASARNSAESVVTYK